MGKNKHPESVTKIIYDPYRLGENDSFDEIYERYKEDNNTVYCAGGRTFYKAAQITLICMGARSDLLVSMPADIEPEKDHIMIDDKGNRYDYEGIAHLCFRRGIPEWYLKMPPVVLRGTYDNIGEYFVKE